MNRTFSQTRLAALYRLSRVGLVTPLRDGMNLVAKEYVAAQSDENPGVLVLSHFAGAAERLRGAVLVNPYDIQAMAAAMQQALDMSLEERRERWAEMIVELRNNDVHGWRDDFLGALSSDVRRRAAMKRLGVSSVLPIADPGRKEGHIGTPPLAACARLVPASARRIQTEHVESPACASPLVSTAL